MSNTWGVALYIYSTCNNSSSTKQRLDIFLEPCFTFSTFFSLHPQNVSVWRIVNMFHQFWLPWFQNCCLIINLVTLFQVWIQSIFPIRWKGFFLNHTFVENFIQCFTQSNFLFILRSWHSTSKWIQHAYRFPKTYNMSRFSEFLKYDLWQSFATSHDLKRSWISNC